jgi:hypothetical protein
MTAKPNDPFNDAQPMTLSMTAQPNDPFNDAQPMTLSMTRIQ